MVEIDRDKRPLIDSENTFQRPFRGGPQQGVDFLRAGILVRGEAEIDNRHIRRRHADGRPVHAAAKMWQYFADRTCGAGRCGNHRHRGGAGPPQILVACIECWLVTGIGMDGGHIAGLDADRIRHHLGDWRQTVGGA